jgi:hypothetical protein
MANSFPLLVLILAPLTVSAVVHAQLAGKSCDFSPYCVERPPADDPSNGAGARLVRAALTISDLRTGHSRPNVYADAAFLRGDTQPRTAIDYRFASEGLVGSVGYSHRLVDGRRIALDEVGLAAAMGFGRPGGLVGAWLHYDFR